MKISPVTTTHTIQQPPANALSPDRIGRAKLIAEGKTPEQPKEAENKLLETVQNKISGEANKTPDKLQPISTNQVSTSDEIPISDATVQTSTEVTAPKEEPQVTEPLSPQLAALARQRRALQVKEKELADKEKALTGPSRADLEARIKSAPLSVLQELGVTYEQLTNEILANQGQINPEVEKLKTEIESIKKGIDTKFSDAQVQQDHSAINYVADKLDALLATGEDFELLKAADGGEEVVRRVFNHWKKTGKELSVAEVAKKYQEELAEEALTYAKLPSVQKRLQPVEPAPVTPEKPQQSGIKTLTNKDTARPSSDRKQRAILAFQGQLKR